MPFSCPHFQVACEALALLEQLAVSLPPSWHELAAELRLSAAAVVLGLARAQAYKGQKRLALQRAARVKAFDISGAIMAAYVVSGAGPSPVAHAASVAYTELVRQLQDTAA
jgi:hypothetical protein